MSVRYDRDVRALVLAFAVSCVAATSGVAHARPAGRDDDRILDPFHRRAKRAPLPPPDPCTQGKTWNAVAACLRKQTTLEVLYDADPVKIVRMAPRAPSPFGQLLMYTRREKRWVRSGFYVMSSSPQQDVRISKFPTPLGDGVRIDTASFVRSVFSPGKGISASRGLVQRVSSMVCTPSTWSCRSALTSCDAYTRGRLLWTFRGELYWHPSLGLRLRGDTSGAGGQCQPPRFMIDVDETETTP
jgi:hypothetical protein